MLESPVAAKLNAMFMLYGMMVEMGKIPLLATYKLSCPQDGFMFIYFILCCVS